MKRHLFLFLGIILSSCASVPEPVKEANPRFDAMTGMQLPEQIGNLQFDLKNVFNEPGLGVQYQYRNANHICSIYIYNNGIKEIPDGVSELVLKEHDTALLEIYAMIQRGVYTDPYMIKRGTQKAYIENGPEFMGSLFGYRKDGVELVSYLFVSAVHNQFIKLRCTHPRRLTYTEPATVLEALRTLSRLMQ